ncbi:MAG: hypothetical protein K2Y18_00070 [Alphaproteobacteria bacterium]|nr:hypothetical protein [Alphaproteobacteria bacterium]
MNKSKFTLFTRKFTFLTSATALSMSAALGTVNDNPSDPLRSNDFCSTTCRVSGPCETKAVQEQCQKICLSDWKTIAKIQLKDNIGFKNANEQEQQHLLNNSPIARCVLPEKAAETRALKPALNTSPGNDLCAAALKKELNDFEHSRSFVMQPIQPLQPLAIHPLRGG